MACVMVAISSICVGGLISLTVGVLFSPQLPIFATEVARPSDVSVDVEPLRLSTVALNPLRNREVPAEAVHALRLAYFSGRPGALQTLQKHADELDALMPEWLAIARSDQGVTVERIGDARHEMAWLRTNAPRLALYPLLRTSLGSVETLRALASPSDRRKLVSALVRFVEDGRFAGVSVRLDELPLSGQNVLIGFLDEVGLALGERKLKLISITGVHQPERRIKELAAASDYLLLVTHDEGSSAQPAPIAAQGWFEEKLATRLAGIDPRKLILGVGAFARDWDLSSGSVRTLSVPAAWSLLDRFQGKLRFDHQSLNGGFTYRDERGGRHEVWVLDSASAFNQLKAGLPYRPAGIAIWELGLEDPGIWSYWAKSRVPDARALKALAAMPAGDDLFSGLRAALISASPGRSGSRELVYNERLGLIVGQKIGLAPRQAVPAILAPVDPKLVALTFDDGPDPAYTGRVLDILAAKKARATFYVVGRNALQFPRLIERIYAEGHDVGNHTFSHPKFDGISGERIAFELNATQRILESTLGVRTVLFRPPTAFADLSYLDDHPQLIETASRLGYQLGALDVDSYDWMTGAWPNAGEEQIVERTVGLVSQGVGQIVLLHDAGGDREATLKALPEIIDRLAAQGFRFVTTHELVGKTRQDIMPPLTTTAADLEVAIATVRQFSLRVMSGLSEAVPAIAIAAAFLAILRLTLIVIGATWHWLRRERPREATWPAGGVAVLIPAYNEEVGVARTVQAILDSAATGRLEIIVIDDGSADRTVEIVRARFGGLSNVRTFTKANGGKAAALNCGLLQTDAEVVVAIDGDTILLPDAIARMVAHFAQSDVGAVAGAVFVGNRNNLMTRFQALEYIMSQNLDRRAFGLFNAIGVVPGAIGAWRRRALVEVGGYATDTLAEDADLTVTLERNGWRVASEPRAFALTEAPETLRGFLKQRFRWMFGTLQVGWKHAGAVLRPGSGVALITLPNIFLFQFAFTLLAPIMDLILVWTVLSVVLSIYLDGMSFGSNETTIMLAKYWIIFQLFDFSACAAALVLNQNRADWMLIPLVVIQRFCYRQLLYVVAIRALLAALRGSFVGWGKLMRTGSVVTPMIVR